jgi:hypothetical protein
MSDSLERKRRKDLESSIQETLDLIKQYEEKRRLADDPKEQKDCERQIADLRQLLEEYRAELTKLEKDVKPERAPESSGIADEHYTSLADRERDLCLALAAPEIPSAKKQQIKAQDYDMEGLADRWHRLLEHARAAWGETGQFMITQGEFIALSEYFRNMDLDHQESLFMLRGALYFGVQIREWVPKIQSEIVAVNTLIDVIRGPYWRPRWRAAVILSEMDSRLIRDSISDALRALDTDTDAACALKKARDEAVTEHLCTVATSKGSDPREYNAQEILWQMGIAVETHQPSVEKTSDALDYKHGLERLRELLTQCSPKMLSEFDTLEARLLDNLHSEQLYGSTETTRAERSRILHALNGLANRAGLNSSYNDLCRE